MVHQHVAYSIVSQFAKGHLEMFIVVLNAPRFAESQDLSIDGTREIGI